MIASATTWPYPYASLTTTVVVPVVTARAVDIYHHTAYEHSSFEREARREDIPSTHCPLPTMPHFPLRLPPRRRPPVKSRILRVQDRGV